MKNQKSELTIRAVFGTAPASVGAPTSKPDSVGELPNESRKPSKSEEYSLM